MLNNPKLISSDWFLSSNKFFRPPKWSIFLADYAVCAGKVALLCSVFPVKNFILFLWFFVLWEVMASTPCLPSQWDLGLYRFLPYSYYGLHLNCSYLIGLFTSAVNTGWGYFWFFCLRVFELGNIAVTVSVLSQKLFMWFVSQQLMYLVQVQVY